MIIIEKALVAIFKDIDIAFHIIGEGSASGYLKKYSTIKANYYYSKVKKI